jgi:hypothetical protein
VKSVQLITVYQQKPPTVLFDIRHVANQMSASFALVIPRVQFAIDCAIDLSSLPTVRFGLAEHLR